MSVAPRRLSLFGFGAVVALVAGLLVAVSSVLAGPAQAIAPGCTSARPTSISGTAYGYPDGRNLNVGLGFDLIDAAGHRVRPDGTASGGGYSFTVWMNRTLAATGGTSGSRGYAPVCVASNVRSVWLEAYPKDSTGHTSKVRYGEANAQAIALRVGAANTNVGARLPLLHQFGGNTGDVNGYITYRGHSVSATALSIRVWPITTAASCGVHGFSAGADVAGHSTSRDATYYRVIGLAGGQCGQASQSYRLFITCYSVCGASSRTAVQYVSIFNGGAAGRNAGF